MRAVRALAVSRAARFVHREQLDMARLEEFTSQVDMTPFVFSSPLSNDAGLADEVELTMTSLRAVFSGIDPVA